MQCLWPRFCSGFQFEVPCSDAQPLASEAVHVPALVLPTWFFPSTRSRTSPPGYPLGWPSCRCKAPRRSAGCCPRPGQDAKARSERRSHVAFVLHIQITWGCLALPLDLCFLCLRSLSCSYSHNTSFPDFPLLPVLLPSCSAAPLGKNSAVRETYSTNRYGQGYECSMSSSTYVFCPCSLSFSFIHPQQIANRSNRFLSSPSLYFFSIHFSDRLIHPANPLRQRRQNPKKNVRKPAWAVEN